MMTADGYEHSEMRSIQDKRLKDARHLIVCWSVSPARAFFEAGITGLVGASLRFAAWEWQVDNPRTVILVDCVTGSPTDIRQARSKYTGRAIIAVLPDHSKESVAKITLSGADAALSPLDPRLLWLKTINENVDKYARRAALSDESPISILRRIKSSAQE